MILSETVSQKILSAGAHQPFHSGFQAALNLKISTRSRVGCAFMSNLNIGEQEGDLEKEMEGNRSLCRKGE